MLTSLSVGLAGMLVGGIIGAVIISMIAVKKVRDIESEMTSWRNMYFALLEGHGMVEGKPGCDVYEAGHLDYSVKSRSKSRIDRKRK